MLQSHVATQHCLLQKYYKRTHMFVNESRTKHMLYSPRLQMLTAAMAISEAGPQTAHINHKAY